MQNYLTDTKTYQFIKNTYPYRRILALLTNLVLLFRKKKVILIFGMSRSGTSMLGEFLALNASSLYVHEPDSALMKYRYENSVPLPPESFWDFVFLESQKPFKAHLLICVMLLAALRTDKSIETICIKPIALLDVMPDVCDAIKSANALYICRHPAGRSESTMRQIKHHQNIDNHPIARLEKLGRDWGMTNQKVQKWFQSHPAWTWVAFEKLAGDPIAEFKALYEKLGLSWDETVRAEIEKKTTGSDGGFYETQRDSRKQIDKWRTALTEEQIEAIRRGSLPFETNLYESF
ncbi:MAG: sulfotransferase [Chloroflexi bacterium]|nr:sulfotransferase [Chloroflexota bacterium]